ncbi:MAG: valine--pyruvate transaminase [Acidobacteria bacterium]|nr:valine--pyruvate transaminase [Acidobacteriota bacterium]
MDVSAYGRRLLGDSGTRSLMDDLGAIAAAGGAIMNLGGGSPSLIPAAEATFRRHMESLLRREGAFERAIGLYGGPEGDRDFAGALAGLLRREVGWKVTARNIALTNGSQSAFLPLFNLLAGPMGDGRPARRILLPLSPEYIGYADLGFTPGLFTARRSTIHELDDKLFKYGVDFDGLDEVEDIGAICVSRPTNPTGNVITDEEVARLGAVARARGVPLILDTAYGAPFPGIVFGESTPVWDEHTVVCMSLSKLGLPGFRTGIVIANEEIIESLSAATAIYCLSPGRLGPALATELIESGELLPLARDVIRPHYADRAARAVDRLRAGLRDYPIRIHKPEGAFFLWLWMPGLPTGNAALYERLKQRDVIVVSGHYFFPGREDDDWPHKRECIRISYADDWERTERGLDIIAEEVGRAYDGAAGRRTA